MDDIDKMLWDVLVVGAGPAGMTFVLELNRLRPELKILVVEFGHKEESGVNELDESVEVLTPLNHHDPYECTNKGIGGTSATWGGRCVSYDEIDFLPREVVKDGCTWNSNVFEEVKKFYPRAGFYLDCGDPVFQLERIGGRNRRIGERFVEGDWTDSTLERWSLPTRFGDKYGENVRTLENVTVLEGVRADVIAPVANGQRVRLIERRTNEATEVCAARVVLSAGTQESTRILLRSPSVFAGRGGTPHALGKFYQGHVSGKIASIKFTGNPELTDFGFIRDNDGVYLRRRLQLSSEALLRENLLNTALWLDNPLYHDPRHRNGTMSFMYLMMISPVLGKKLAPAAIRNSVTGKRVHALRGHILNIVRDLPRSIYEPLSIFAGRYLSRRKLPGVFLYSNNNEYALHFHAEQQPVECNNMRIGPDGKTLVISYGYTDDDIESIIRTHASLDSWLRATGAGELKYWYPENELRSRIREGSSDGIHQNGTIRMSMSPDVGVVDTNLRVWGTENLFVCSSAVFPTSGQANPTFLQTAFAARLASHLGEII